MYGLPSDFDSRVFVGKVLNRICFSENTIALTFDTAVQITVMGSFIHREKKCSSVNRQLIPVSRSSLMDLTGKRVRLAEARQDGTLTLYFDNDHSLILLDDSNKFEAYIIRIDEKEIVV